MAAFDKAVFTIRDDDWDDGEEVVIREPTYGDSIKMQKACMRKDGELDTIKYADMLLPNAIVSWTFLRDGEPVPVSLANIKELPTSYVTFITEKIAGFVLDTDAEFPDTD